MKTSQELQPRIPKIEAGPANVARARELVQVLKIATPELGIGRMAEAGWLAKWLAKELA
jgi:hypothetical protein